jgi:hypothetical protein
MNNTTKEETKQITFEGRTYTVPTWVRWVARDEDNEVRGYEDKPTKNRVQWYAPIRGDVIGRNIPLGWSNHWEDSLVKV